MTDLESRALLPVGLRDILPPDAEHEADVVHRLMGDFAGYGYERVKPPLIEFEESLLAGSGSAVAGHTFRIMDPVSQRMLAVRPDMTLQVARIATTRLRSVPRPLRLSYAGQVLRVKGSQLRPERQFGQAGIELIGAETPEADAEVILLAAQALQRLGVPEVSVDLTLPTLVPALLAAVGVVADGALREALDHKDVASVAVHGGAAAAVLEALIGAAGPADRALAVLQTVDLPAAAAAERDRLSAVVAALRRAKAGFTLTVDPVENRGFEYHTGVSFTIFSRQAAGEMGRGGRYLAAGVEPATGATLFMDTVLGALPGATAARRLYLPADTSPDLAARLRRDGWVTVAGLEAVPDVRAEARRLGCGHVVAAGKPVATDQEGI